MGFDESQTSDLDEAVVGQDAGLGSDTESRGEATCSIGPSQFARQKIDEYFASPSEKSLADAISATRKAVNTIQEDDTEKTGMLLGLSWLLGIDYDNRGDLSALYEGVPCAARAVSIASETHLPMALHRLAWLLLRRYERTGWKPDLDVAISKAEESLQKTAEDDDHLSARLGDLASMLHQRFLSQGTIVDLESSIVRSREAIDLTPEDHPARSVMRSILAAALMDRFSVAGKEQDLGDAISLSQELISSTNNTDHLEFVRFSNMLRTRYDKYGKIDDLETAISRMNQALSMAPQSPEEPLILRDLAVMLLRRYERFSEAGDLNEAISKIQLATTTLAEGHPMQSNMIAAHSVMLLRQFERTGNPKNLDTAISKGQQVLAVTSKESPEWRDTAGNLSNMLLARFKLADNISDLDRAILMEREAWVATLRGSPAQVTRLASLGMKLCHRYQATSNKDNLDEAAALLEMARTIVTPNTAREADLLQKLGTVQEYQYIQYKEEKYIHGAIRDLQRALSITPEGSNDRASVLNSLGMALFNQAKRSRDGGVDRFEEAISHIRTAIKMTRKSTNLATYKVNLGTLLVQKAKALRTQGGMNEALVCFKQAGEASDELPLRRLEALHHTVKILASRQQWLEASLAAEKAIGLLSTLGPHSDRTDQLHAVHHIAHLAPEACSLFLKVGDVGKALEQLEFGRGLLLGCSMDGRGDLSELRRASPNLASKFEELRFQANRPIQSYIPRAFQHDSITERDKAIGDLNDCISEIRLSEESKRFLLPATAVELENYAVDGPIVIVNVTAFGSHAIVIPKTLPADQASESRAFEVELPEMTPDKAPFLFGRDFEEGWKIGLDDKAQMGDMESDTAAPNINSVDFLEWLWSCCVKIVLEALGICTTTTTEEPPRVWWIGSGVASALPFHAAGAPHDDFRESTLSCTIPSYIPTIKALSHSRLCASRGESLDVHRPSVLIVTMPEKTDTLQPLSLADREGEVVQSQIKTNSLLRQPPAAEVLINVEKFDIFHYVGHAQSDRSQPFNSTLLLRKHSADGPQLDLLTVQKLSNQESLERARIVYLSTCSRTENPAADYVDEAIRLSTAFQMAGFGHAIISLWPADDKQSATTKAGLFYKFLTENDCGADSNRAVAKALRDAALEIRKAHADAPSMWAPYIHSGA